MTDLGQGPFPERTTESGITTGIEKLPFPRRHPVSHDEAQRLRGVTNVSGFVPGIAFAVDVAQAQQPGPVAELPSPEPDEIMD